MDMSSYDPEVARRVWSRVQSTAAPTAEPALGEMVAYELAAAAAYEQLARRMQGNAPALLRRMAAQERSHAACLRGMCQLEGQSFPKQPPFAGARERVRETLCRAYTDELRSAEGYEKLANHPCYGYCFAAMAAQEREHSRLVLELLGKNL